MACNEVKEGCCYVYIMCRQIKGEMVSPVKVGITCDLLSRRAQMQTNSPAKIVVYAAFLMSGTRSARAVERMVHDELRDSRCSGISREWFETRPRVALLALTSAVQIHRRGDDTGIFWILNNDWASSGNVILDSKVS
jgi:hypothetical protein